MSKSRIVGSSIDPATAPQARILTRNAENIAHGLPLSRADRRAAAERIIASHPHMSDRAISHSVGLGTKIVADIRRRSSEDLSQLNARVGRDGKVRPVDSGEGRRRAAELLAQHPEASMRAVARAVGISPATVNDVRKRLERGDSAVPGKHPANDRARSGAEAKTDSDETPVPARLRRLPVRVWVPIISGTHRVTGAWH